MSTSSTTAPANVLGFVIAVVLAASSAAGAAPSPAGGPPQSSAADLAARIRAYIATQAVADTFSGVVLLAKHGQVIYSGAVGMASKEYSAPNTVYTSFNIGSINKLMTRIAIVQLVAQHKLSYDDTIGKLLPEYPNKSASGVTVRELLEMSSGIGDFFGPAYQATPKAQLRTLADYVPLFAAKPLAFAPGTQQAYSNGGFIALGLIIERVSGMSYYDFIQQHIFGPAGMTASGWFERDIPRPGVASGYTKMTDHGDSPAWLNNIYTAPARGSSAGGGYASAPDLLKFAAALEDGKLLDAAGTAQVLGPGIGVAGGAPGINADLEIDPQSGYVLVVLSNYDPPSAENVARQIRGWIGLD